MGLWEAVLRRLQGSGGGIEDAAPDSSGYRAVWSPSNDTDAMGLILNETDAGKFEASGRHDAEEVLGPLIRSSDTVLDLGCGIGRVTRYVAPLCREVWAVDISPRMLELARSRLAGLANVRFALSNEASLPEPPTASVDFAYSLLTLQHVEREHAFALMREVRRVLRPGGVAHFTFPNLLSDEYLHAFLHYVESGEANSNPARARFYTPEEIHRVVPAAGFEIVDFEVEVEIRVTCRAAD
jgi:ubiquinone/menaquinone biosynthesis C-methylase UbiE